jgi:hypothetical protein
MSGNKTNGVISTPGKSHWDHDDDVVVVDDDDDHHHQHHLKNG